jgi:hypothetical protein
MSSYPTPEELRGAVRGTLLYLALYLFGFIQFQSYSKFYLLAQKKKEAKKSDEKVSWRATKYYNSHDKLALVGDRAVGNMLEFAILFLPLYWIHAVLVDSTTSWEIALVYTVFRALYPFLFYYKPTLIVLSTGPGYVILLYLMWQIGQKYVWA